MSQQLSAEPLIPAGYAPKGMRDSKGRVHTVGKNKTAVARVWITEGTGTFTINRKDPHHHFKDERLFRKSQEAFFVSKQLLSQYDIRCTLTGGGLSAQAKALRHGTSLALIALDPSLRSPLKSSKFLQGAIKQVERKKPGQAKARKKFQFCK